MKKKQYTKDHSRMIVGWREWISLPDLGIPAIKAKIDTGARTSALHVFDLEEFEDNGTRMVRFGIQPLRKNKSIICRCEAPVLEQRNVKNSGGHSENRYIIQTTAVLGDTPWPISISLTNRDLMMFRMLLGRKALEDRFLISPGHSYLTGRSLAKSYKGKLVNMAAK